MRFIKNIRVDHVVDLIDEMNLENVQIVNVEKCFMNGDQESMNLVYLTRSIHEDQIKSKLKSFLVFRNRKLDSLILEIFRSDTYLKVVVEKQGEFYKLFTND